MKIFELNKSTPGARSCLNSIKGKQSFPPAATAECYGAGDPHYRSWDGRYYDFQGSCTYCLVKTIDFEVRHKNFNGGRVSFVEYVHSFLLYESKCNRYKQ